jgi:hypothetical protein
MVGGAGRMDVTVLDYSPAPSAAGFVPANKINHLRLAVRLPVRNPVTRNGTPQADLQPCGRHSP